MAKDAQGHSLSGANAPTAGFINAAVRAFTLNYGDVNAHLDDAQAQSPDCKVASLLRAWLPALSNDPAQIADSRRLAAARGAD